MIGDSDWVRLVRYATGECTPTEAAEMRRWIDADPERHAAAAQLTALHEVGRAACSPSTRWDVDSAWARVTSGPTGPASPPAAPLPDLTPRPIGDRRRRGGRGPRFLGPPLAPIAGALLVVAAGAFMWNARAGRAADHAEGAALREFATARGQRAEVRLADGTRVTLSVESRLRVPADFGTRTRDVYLDGEGYFAVVHDAARPFVVHAAHGVAEDLGTEFAVRSYPGDSALQVVVAEGRVVLRSAEGGSRRSTARHVVLGKGDLGVAGPAGLLASSRAVDVATYTGWTEGRIVFTRAPLPDVAAQLERWYDLHIELTDPEIASRRLTASLTAESLPEMLDIVALSLDLRYERVGRTVLLYPKRHPRPPRLPGSG